MSFVITTGVTDLARTASEQLWPFSHSLLFSVFFVKFWRQEKCLSPSSMPERYDLYSLILSIFACFIYTVMCDEK